ncbi:MAG: type I methionyl aminopeptidase [Chitinophagaceae bacterium]
MILYKSKEEIESIRQSASLVSATLAEVAKFLKPGVSTEFIDHLAEDYIRDHGGVPSFKNYKGFPKTCCISVNEAVVHGIPGPYQLQEGDIVSVDCGVYLHGFHGDSAYTFALGEVSGEVLKLMAATKASLYAGIEKAVAGNRLGDISYAIQNYAEKQRGYGVVRELVGHGIGRDLHEDPQVANYGKRGNGPTLKEGLVIAIEPMINLGTYRVEYSQDGWTVSTKDGRPSAHYEHTVAVGKGPADILSSFDAIEEEEMRNLSLNSTYLLQKFINN